MEFFWIKDNRHSHINWFYTLVDDYPSETKIERICRFTTKELQRMTLKLHTPFQLIPEKNICILCFMNVKDKTFRVRLCISTENTLYPGVVDHSTATIDFNKLLYDVHQQWDESDDIVTEFMLSDNIDGITFVYDYPKPVKYIGYFEIITSDS